jgi:hypothetical protein
MEVVKKFVSAWCEPPDADEAFVTHMSALGQKQTFAVQNGMSALPPIATSIASSESPVVTRVAAGAFGFLTFTAIIAAGDGCDLLEARAHVAAALSVDASLVHATYGAILRCLGASPT